MADILELSAEYRNSGLACQRKLVELTDSLVKGDFCGDGEYTLRRQITLLYSMSRECLATSNYLRLYFEGRERLDKLRQEAGI